MPTLDNTWVSNIPSDLHPVDEIQEGVFDSLNFKTPD